jgi:hypothetical protein
MVLVSGLLVSEESIRLFQGDTTPLGRECKQIFVRLIPPWRRGASPCHGGFAAGRKELTLSDGESYLATTFQVLFSTARKRSSKGNLV